MINIIRLYKKGYLYVEFILYDKEIFLEKLNFKFVI